MIIFCGNPVNFGPNLVHFGRKADVEKLGQAKMNLHATCENCDDSRIATYGTFEHFKVF